MNDETNFIQPNPRWLEATKALAKPLKIVWVEDCSCLRSWAAVTALHGDGLVKLQGCAHELSHLAVKTPQLTIELAVG